MSRGRIRASKYRGPRISCAVRSRDPRGKPARTVLRAGTPVGSELGMRPFALLARCLLVAIPVALFAGGLWNVLADRNPPYAARVVTAVVIEFFDSASPR